MTEWSRQAALIAVTLLLVAYAVGAARLAPPRLVEAGATYFQVTWEGQEHNYNYRVEATAVDGGGSYRSPIVLCGPVTLVGLTPATKYRVKLQAVASAIKPAVQLPAKATLRVVSESKSLEVATEPWEARGWSDLRLWPSRHIDSFPAETTYPALAAYEGDLLLVEVYQGTLYVSQVVADTFQVVTKRQLWKPSGQQVIRAVDATVIKDKLWVTWISQASTSAGGAEDIQMLIDYDLQAGAAGKPVKLHPAVGCGLTSFSGSLWSFWQQPGASGGTMFARYDRLSGLVKAQEWAAEGARWAGTAAANLGAELFVAGIKSVPAIHPPPVRPITGVKSAVQFRPISLRRHQLWAARFNGQRFYGCRMLRGRGHYSSVAGAAVDDAVVVVYASRPQVARDSEELSDIDITLTRGSAGRVVSTSYIRDGTYNTEPDAVSVGQAVFVAYNKWSGRPERNSLKSANYGTFIGKIDVEF